MKILVLNGSPRKEGLVSKLLQMTISSIKNQHNVQWIDVSKLNMKFCTGCMACRKTDKCVLPFDDAHRIGDRIKEADAIIIGTPTYWGNMSAPLKVLFDRNVPVFMGESSLGIPLPRQKGKTALIVTACTTPWPFNFIFAQSRGATCALKEILHYGGYKILGKIVKPNSKKSGKISNQLKKRAINLGRRLTK